MKFSHLIRINDARETLITPLTRDELWRGLMMRAESPLLFVMALDECSILARDAHTLRRELRFGSVTLRDRVSFLAPHQVRYDIEANADSPAASLVMTIEEPEAGQLFVRFAYQTGPDSADSESEGPYDGFVKQAYVQSDIDTVRTIRRLAGEGKLRD